MLVSPYMPIRTPGEIISFRDGTILRAAKIDEFKAIDSLRKKEGAALGFVPRATYDSILEQRRVGDRDRWKYAEILVTEDNGDFTGFCYVSFAGDFAKIFQIVVRSDARRWHRALLMEEEVEEKARKLGKTGVTCRVAVDLESNVFWRGIGFRTTETTTSTWLNQKESQSKRPLYIYEKRFDERQAGLLL